MPVTPITTPNVANNVTNKKIESIDDQVRQQSVDPAAAINAVYYAYLMAEFKKNLYDPQENSPYVMKVEIDW